MSNSKNHIASDRLSEIKKIDNLNQAINKIKELLEEFPDFILGWLELGLIQRKLGDHKASVNTFIKLDACLSELGKTQKALDLLENAANSYPNEPHIMLKIGDIYREQDSKQALKYYQRALDINPKNLWANLNIATELRKLGHLEAAEKQLSQALEYHPNHFKIFIHYGYLERRLGRRNKALNYFNIAKQKASNPDQKLEAQILAIEELRELGKISEAIATIRPILQQSPNNIQVKLIYGNLLKLKLDFGTAVELYREIINLQPNNNQAHLELAICLGKLGKNQEALEFLENAAHSLPNELQIMLEIGDIYREKQDNKQALKYYQRALDLNPKNLWANLNIATELRGLGDLEAAEKQLHQALEYHPNHFHVLMQLAQLEQTRQKSNLALEYLQKAIGHNPHRIEPHLRIIDIWSNLGRLTEAKNKLDTLQQNYPEEFCILLHCGYFERRLGHREKALNYFNIAKQQAPNLAQKLEAQILEIEELRDLGHLDQGMQLIEPIIQQYPENIRAQMTKGSILQKKPNLIAAANLYKTILATEPNHVGSRIELAKTYSQLGQIETAISLLEETYQLLGVNAHIFILLGSLNQALEDWEMAGHWYQKACQEYPYNPHGYCHLANLMSLQGETDAAIKFLHQAQVTIPLALPIFIQLIEFQLRLGNFEVSHQLLQDALEKFPNNVQLLWQLCRLNMGQGNYAAALETLDEISTDNQDWIRQTEQLRANIYFYQYDYQQAEKHFEQAISSAPIATEDRNRLATIFMLTGRLKEARQELKIATEELQLKTSPGKTTVPLKSHPAMLTNALRINPPMLVKLQTAQEQTGKERILALARLLVEQPKYLGTALYLARELRTQGIFDNLQQALSRNSTTLTTIPKRIVQFWDEPKPPQEVQRICQSWLDFNPEYQYIRFSLETAVAFLQEHYDPKVLKAFNNCDQPATQADFFRLAYLNKMGGFYADADDLCRQSLDNIVDLKAELVVLQEDFACIGNNFLGCIPGQAMIRTAFHRAVCSLSHYCNDGPWFQTGPGLITSAICSGLLPYLAYTDYQIWPRLLVLTQAHLRKIINQHLPLAYKRTPKSWHQNAYQRRIKILTAK